MLLWADGAALCISNQKKNSQGGTVYHHTLQGNLACPTWALVQKVADAVVGTNNTNALISHLSRGWEIGHVSAGMVRLTARKVSKILQLHKQGVLVVDGGSYSFWANRAMVMKLSNYDLVIIMQHGYCTSLTFLTYIHNQITHSFFGFWEVRAER